MMCHNTIMNIIMLMIMVAILTLAAGLSEAEVPRMIQYQGRLTDDVGNPLDTTVGLTFAVFNDSLGSVKIWEESHPAVSVANGLFDVMLGQTTVIGKTVFDGSRRWLGISVGGGDVLQPMTPIVSTGYSLKSQYADTASYATNARKADTATVALNVSNNGWVDAGNEVYLSTITDSVGIGTDNPGAPLEVEGPAGHGHAMISTSHGSGTAAGVLGMNDSDGFGLMGVSSNGRGVTGLSTTGFGGHFYGPKNYFSSNLGIGTESPGEMLHVYKNSSGSNIFMKVQSDHATNWGQTGIKFATPENTWRFFLDDDSHYFLNNEGAFGLYNEYSSQVSMIWTRNGNVGIPAYSPNYRLSVYGTTGGIFGYATTGIGLYGYSEYGYGGYFYGPKNYFAGKTGFGTTDPTHRVTVNGELALQKNEVTKYHLNYYNAGFNICETSVADYRLYIKDGGNVGIGTSNPTTKLYVAGTFHADSFEADAIGKANIIDEPGVVAGSADIATNFTSSWYSFLSRSITVPASGYILAIGCASISLLHQISGGTGAEIVFSNINGDPSGGLSQEFRLESDVPEGVYHAGLTIQRLFTVSAGTHTIYMLGRENSDNNAWMYKRIMSLIFIPTYYSSKSGEASEAEENLYQVTDKALAEIYLSERPQNESERTASISGDKLDEMQARVESLTAEIEALKNRLQAVENK